MSSEAAANNCGLKLPRNAPRVNARRVRMRIVRARMDDSGLTVVREEVLPGVVVIRQKRSRGRAAFKGPELPQGMGQGLARRQRLREMERLGAFLVRHLAGIAAYCGHP